MSATCDMNVCRKAFIQQVERWSGGGVFGYTAGPMRNG